MSALVRCDGCGASEPKRTHKAIVPVELRVVFDSRMPPEVYRADLCEQCQGHLLFEYFGVKPEGKLAVPAFLGPTNRERAVG